MPLTAIADLSLVKKRMQKSSAEFSPGELNIATLSDEERELEIGKLNPTLVLNNLADFINTQELTQKRI